MAEHLREIRVALVLYGGVSLAVYENGVTRCFFDLVRQRGIFGVLLEMLDATATVDVVAGTSAGGLNGLFLAAALESGAEFSSVGELWRRLGDMGALLCEVEHTGETDALLKGGYFHEELIKAFEGLCTVKDPNYRSPGEMDVFITGTDLDGQVRSYQDGLGREISDKLHRTVFHLQHRPERKSLGIRMAKSEVDARKQAEILGTIGRITACFPVAFPPIKGTALKPELRQRLDDSLLGVPSETRPFSAGHSFVDGGVLDNKPFGPALRAIFFRMPGGIVDRRLFYVEPDPVPIAREPREHRSPLEVGMACSGSIPSHESITDDLERLLEHNQRIGWLSSVHKLVRRSSPMAKEQAAPVSAAYMDARLECLSRMIVLHMDSPPSALDYPKDAKRAALLLEVRRILKGEENGGDDGKKMERLRLLDRYDVVFHLRRAFHMLYSFHHELEAGQSCGEGSQHVMTAMRLTGRVIKVLKIILESMLFIRDRFMAGYLGSEGADVAAAAQKLEEDFRAFLQVDQTVWEPLRPYLLDRFEAKRHADEPHRFFASEDLSRLVDAIWKGGGWSVGKGSSGTTVLDCLALVLEGICHAVDGSASRLEEFRAIDAELYPAEFASGVFELDAVEFVRISPDDAQIGLSRREAGEKVAGDELAHFSAFLRRDWRSNDILYGRLDGICQIVSALLDDAALERVLRRGFDLASAFTSGESGKPAMFLSESRRKSLVAQWDGLRKAWDARKAGSQWDEVMKKAARSFREELIVSGQEEAFGEEIQSIFKDMHYQEMKFGKKLGPRGAQAGTADALIESDAEKHALEDLKDLSHDEKWERFLTMSMGSQTAVGHKGQLPGSVVGEYVTLVYLAAWGLLRKSVGDRAGGVFDRWSARLIFRAPAFFAHFLFVNMRRERPLALTLSCLAAGVLTGMAVSAFLCGSWRLFTFSVVGLLGALGLLTLVLKGGPRP